MWQLPPQDRRLEEQAEEGGRERAAAGASPRPLGMEVS